MRRERKFHAYIRFCYRTARSNRASTFRQATSFDTATWSSSHSIYHEQSRKQDQNSTCLTDDTSHSGGTRFPQITNFALSCATQDDVFVLHLPVFQQSAKFRRPWDLPIQSTPPPQRPIADTINHEVFPFPCVMSKIYILEQGGRSIAIFGKNPSPARDTDGGRRQVYSARHECDHAMELVSCSHRPMSATHCPQHVHRILFLEGLPRLVASYGQS